MGYQCDKISLAFQVRLFTSFYTLFPTKNFHILRISLSTVCYNHDGEEIHKLGDT